MHTRLLYRAPSALVLAGLLAVLSCGESSGPDDGGGPGTGGLVAIGDTVSARWNVATSRNYYLRAQSAVTIAAYGDAIYDDFAIEIMDSATGAVLNAASVDRHPPHPSYQLNDFHTGPAELAAGQTAHIRLTRGTPNTVNARYRLAIVAVDVAPEIHAAVLQLGDTVNGETMASPVDVDRFYLRNTTGGLVELAVFAQSRAGFLYLAVQDSTTGQLLGSRSLVPDLTVRPVPHTRLQTFPLAAGQNVRIQLLQIGPGTGDYQLWFYPVNRAPESVPAAFALNDTIQGEMLENSADIDEFTVTVPATPDFIAYYQGSGSSSVPISMAVTGGGQSRLEVFYRPSANLQDLNTGLFWPLTGGTLTVSHSAYSIDQAVLHPYRFMLRKIDRQPEIIPAPITAGDSIVGETIGYIGDVDEFPFAGFTGQTVTLSIRALNGFYPLGVVMELIVPGGEIWDVAARSTNGVLSSTGPIQLPEDGTYLVRIHSLSSTVGIGGYEALLE